MQGFDRGDLVLGQCRQKLFLDHFQARNDAGRGRAAGSGRFKGTFEVVHDVENVRGDSTNGFIAANFDHRPLAAQGVLKFSLHPQDLLAGVVAFAGELGKLVFGGARKASAEGSGGGAAAVPKEEEKKEEPKFKAFQGTGNKLR